MASSEGSYNLKLDFGSLKQQLNLMLKDYKGWIGRNPGRASDVESFFKILAYLLPGRIRGNSTVLPELLYSTANVLSFWHDNFLRQQLELAAQQARAERLPPREHRNGRVPHAEEESLSNEPRTSSKKDQIFKIQVSLTILEYFEVFLEVAAKKLWGDVGRWIIIFVMQSIKAGLRAALLFYYKVGLIRSPAIPSFDRSKYLPHKVQADPDVVFVLKHSGRVIRKLHASPPMHSRDWNVPETSLSQMSERDLPRDKLIAEMIHISRPLCHLVSLGACGTNSWKPWLLSLAMDVGSLYLHGDPITANKNEQTELRKRTFALLLYLLRSPFYDRSTKIRLISSLESVGNRIPIIGNIFLLLAQAIPQWQSTYSYVWNDF